MEHDFWHDLWREGKLGFNQSKPSSHLISNYEKWGLKEGEGVLVPLCGKSVDMDFIVEKSHPVLGVELVEDAISQYFQERNLPYEREETENFSIYRGENITLKAGDFFLLTRDFAKNHPHIYDRASIVALPPEMRKSYVEKLKSLFKAHSKALIILFEYEGPLSLGPPFSVTTQEVVEHFGDEFQVDILHEILIEPKNPKFVLAGIKEFYERVLLVSKK